MVRNQQRLAVSRAINYQNDPDSFLESEIAKIVQNGRHIHEDSDNYFHSYDWPVLSIPSTLSNCQPDNA